VVGVNNRRQQAHKFNRVHEQCGNVPATLARSQ